MASAGSLSAGVPESTSSGLYNLTSSLPFSLSAATTGPHSWVYTTAAIILSLLVLEQSVYRYKKGHLPGATWTIPVIGKFADSMKPTMQGYMASWNAGPLSAISVFNIFIVMASTGEYARKILNSPNHAEPALVHAGKQILRPENWVFLAGKAHVDYRRGINTLFTRKSLGIYMSVMDQITRKHLALWLQSAAKNPEPQPIMWTARDLNMETSLRVFCGRHIPDHATKEISDKYWLITTALELVNFPLAIPGTKVYRAIQARKIANKWLGLAAKGAKEAMAADPNAEPECMLEAWVRELESPTYKGRRDFSDDEMAMVIFSFLFASQDAMSSGLIIGFQHLADHPHILAKIREEQERVRGGDFEKPLTLELYDEMPYLRAFVKETLREKPPVLMVPYKTTKAFPISDDYTVPAGSMVIPSFWMSLHDPEVYPEPDKLLPERWLDPEGPANQNPRNYLVFGSGPHKCVGLEYAMMNIGLVLATAANQMNWEHKITPESNELQIIATIFPKDGCLLKFSPRSHH